MDKIALPHHHGETDVISYSARQLAAVKDFETVADVFRLLGDSSRVRIFWLLCHCEECVINISALVGMSSPAVSHHLRELKQSGLIVSRRQGKEVHYRAADTEEAHLLHEAIEKIMSVSCPILPEEANEEDMAQDSDALQAQAACRPEYIAIVRQIHEQLLENLAQRVTIDELAKQYHINACTLKAVFKAVYGGSIAAHMKKHRMEKAASLLRETDMSIAAIAGEVGYENQSKFTAAFREMYGKAPTAYRRGE